MAVTQVNYTGNGSTTNYSFTFPYLEKTDVKVRIDGTIQNTTEYSFANATTIAMDTAPASGAKVVILRDTNVDSKKATFYAGSAIKAEDLNDNSDQVLYTVQEIDNNAMTSDGTTPMTGDLVLGEDLSLVFEGATDDNFETELQVADPTADRTITLPNETGTIITSAGTNVIDSAHYVDGSIDLAHMSANSVDSDQYVDGSIDLVHMSANSVDSDQYVDGSIDLVHMSANSVDSDQYVDGSIDLVHMSANSVDSDQYVDSSIDRIHLAADIVDGTKIADDSIDSEHIVADSIDTEHYAANSVDTTALAVDAVTGAQIADDAVDSEHYVDGSIDLQHLAADSVDGTKITDNAINSEHYVDGSIDREHLAADIVDGTKIANDSIDSEHIAADSIDTEHYAAGSVDSTALATDSVTTSEIADAELTTLAGMQSGTASVLAAGTTLTATLTEINAVCDGKSVHTTISDSDAHYPTSGAVVDYVAAQIAPLGGLEVIATEVAFPNTQPASGVVISISDAGGVVFNGSGVSTTGRTVGNSTVTINGAPSSLYSETLVAGVGLMVSSTGSSQTYNYHKILGKEDDIKQLSDDINDFNARYRVNAGEPSSNNDEGDLIYDTNADKMKVYDGSAWGEVTSTGDFKFLVPVDAGTTTAATWDGSDTSFDLKETTNSGSAASITSVYQLMISVNGVVQKPNTGTYSGSEEGFYLTDSDTIRFCTAPPTGSSVFVIQFGSALSPTTPADNTVATAKIQNLAVTTAKIAADAVDATKIADDAVGAEHIEVLDAALQFGDSVKAQFGAGNDLEVYHNGSHSYIDENGSGILAIRSNGTEVAIASVSGESMARFINDGAVELYHNNAKKLSTHQYGVDIDGNVYIGDSGEGKLLIGAGEDLQIYHDGTHSWVQNATGNLYLGNASGNANHIHIQAKYGDEGIIVYDDAQVELYYDNSKKLETKSWGVEVTGAVDVGTSYFKVDDNGHFYAGNDEDLQIWHDAGAGSNIKCTGTKLEIRSNDLLLQNVAAEKYFRGVSNGDVELYYDNSKKFETTASGVNVPSGNLQIPDSGGTGYGRLQLGSGQDLQIYHDGTHSRVKNTTGYINFESDRYYFNDPLGLENCLDIISDGAINLYYDGVKKFETTSDGCKMPDGARLGFGAAEDLRIYHDGSDSYIHDDGTGHLIIRGDGLQLQRPNGNMYVKCVAGGTVELYYDNSKKFETTTNSVKITGHCEPSGDANGTNIGQSGNRWTNIFASNAPINTSDRNEKNTIQDCDLGLSFIDKLKPVSYKWNNKEAGTKTNYGLIAQDLLEVIEEEGKSLDDFGPIHKEEGSAYGLNYTQLISPLIKALQEAVAKIETLETKVAALEAK